MSGTPKRRGSSGTGASQGTREALVGAAIATLAQAGYAGATARVIASRADCNQALVFYHFGSVDGLLLAALEAVSSRRMATLGVLVDEAVTPGDLVTAFERVIADDIRSGDLGVLVALIDAGRGNPALAQAVGERLGPWQDLTERAIRRLLAAHPLGALVPIPVPVIARLVMAAVLGMELLSIPDSRDAASLLDVAARLRELAGTTAIDGAQERSES